MKGKSAQEHKDEIIAKHRKYVHEHKKEINVKHRKR
jgi:hypothetical protein